MIRLTVSDVAVQVFAGSVAFLVMGGAAVVLALGDRLRRAGARRPAPRDRRGMEPSAEVAASPSGRNGTHRAGGAGRAARAGAERQRREEAEGESQGPSGPGGLTVGS